VEKNRTPYLQLGYIFSPNFAIVILSSRNIPSMQHNVLLLFTAFAPRSLPDKSVTAVNFKENATSAISCL